MWKVQKADEGDGIVLLVSGRIEGKHVTELRKVFALEAGSEDFILDMKEVRLVDQDAIAFLSHCEETGAILRNCPAYIREWIERERETQPCSWPAHHR